MSVINVSYWIGRVASRRKCPIFYCRREVLGGKLRTDFDLALSNHGAVSLPHDTVNENGLERVREELISGKDILIKYSVSFYKRLRVLRKWKCIFAL